MTDGGKNESAQVSVTPVLMHAVLSSPPVLVIPHRYPVAVPIAGLR